jgi:tight adherence protein B
MDFNLLISAFFALGIALTFLGLDLLISSRKVTLQGRIDGFATLPKAGPDDSSSQSGGGGISRLKGLTPNDWRRRIATQLARADLPITPKEYLSATTLFAVFGFLAGYAIFGNVIFGLIGLAAGLYAPRFYVGYLQNKRLEAFSAELESALSLLANTLRSGFALTQALESVAKEFAPPLSVEFGRVVREVALGLALKDALDNLVRRNPILDLEMVVTAININHEVGGNLSEVLDQIASTIRDRVRIASEVRAITSMQRMSSRVLMLLPVGLILVISVINFSYVALLWQSTCGLFMLALGAIMLGIGYLVMRRILKFRY